MPSPVYFLADPIPTAGQMIGMRAIPETVNAKGRGRDPGVVVLGARAKDGEIAGEMDQLGPMQQGRADSIGRQTMDMAAEVGQHARGAEGDTMGKRVPDRTQGVIRWRRLISGRLILQIQKLGSNWPTHGRGLTGDRRVRWSSCPG
jgi:hypothetical protein